MQTFWKKSANLSLFFSVALFVFCASPVFAQRDATSKALGRSNSFNSQETRTQAYYRAGETRRNFSFAPVSFQAGDRVEVSTADTQVMRGSDTVGTLKHGESFQVTKVMGQWLGISTEHNGQKINGWVYQGHVMAEGSAMNPPAAPQVERRAYSYQPSTQYYNSGNYYYQPAKEPWQYPKTDPRRYRIHGN